MVEFSRCGNKKEAKGEFTSVCVLAMIDGSVVGSRQWILTDR